MNTDPLAVASGILVFGVLLFIISLIIMRAENVERLERDDPEPEPERPDTAYKPRPYWYSAPHSDKAN